jgi:3-keto-disaccharide hydrolase
VGEVAVWGDHFRTKSDVTELASAGGKHCRHNWRKQSETLFVVVERGPDACVVRPALKSDGERPNHLFHARIKVTRDTPEALRDDAYVGLEVRSGPDTGYELRVFPKSERWRLMRSPDGGGFPQKGTAGKIRPVNEFNSLELRALGDKVKALVNGKVLTEVTDSSPGEVSGRRVAAVIGNKKETDREVFGVLDDLVLACRNSGC